MAYATVLHFGGAAQTEPGERGWDRMTTPHRLHAGVLMELVHSDHLTFSTIESALTETLFEPDAQAFHVLLACVASHYLRPHGYPPVWVMLIGPSGSGKTTMLKLLPSHFHLSDLTPQTFLSGYRPNGKRMTSLLHRLGDSAVVTIQDFTTVLSMRHEKKSEIMAQLREIHDGSTSKVTGMGDVISWAGRITFIACCTPAVDRDRMTFRTLGDRFMEVRWNGPPSIALARAIAAGETVVDTTWLKRTVKEYITQAVSSVPRFTPAQLDKLSLMAEAVALLRTPVVRDEKGYHIISVDRPESPSRIVQALASVALAGAALDGEPWVRDSDMALSCRMAHDSVPHHRMKVLDAMDEHGLPQDAEVLTSMSQWVRRSTLQDLEELGAINESLAQDGSMYYFKTPRVELLKTEQLSFY